MKKLIFLFLGIYCFIQLDAQIYLKPIITSESSPGACDASVTVIPYGGTPPYSVDWGGEGSWTLGSGFTAENLCAGEIMGVTVMDANCKVMSLSFRIATDPLNQTILDTIVITYPTTGNNDGSVQLFFSNLPSGYGSHWKNYGGSISITPTDMTFTDLNEDLYFYSVSGGGSPMEISIPLFSGVNEPCNTFSTYEIPSHFTSFIDRSPECETVPVPIDTLFNDTTYTDTTYVSFCNGGVSIYSTLPASGENYNRLFHTLDGGAADVNTSDSLGENFNSLCRGPYLIQTYNTENEFNFYNMSTFFIQDSLDLTNYWNLPDTLPLSTDTVVTDALNVPIINYGIPLDTAFISDMNYIGANQYEIVTAFVQVSDTFVVYTTEFLDSSLNYILDITTFEGDSLLCDVNNAYRNVIYFEWPIEEEPCDSVLICHIPPGNPSNQHTILVPCEDVEDHLNHGDELGECVCNRSMTGSKKEVVEKSKYLQMYPNPADAAFQLRSTSIIQRTEVYSLDGKCHLTVIINGNSGMIDTRELAPSTYFVKVYYEDGSIDTKKWMKLSNQ